MARTRIPRPPTRQTALPLPPDVRLMNALASTVFVAAGVGVAVAGVLWLMRSPMWPIRAIQLDGDLARNSVPTIRANAAPLLAGNFFSVDLQQGRAAFETVPWVRRAVVRRVWPDRLAVRLEEHRAAALWEGSDPENSTDRLVNSFGEVFKANVGDVEDDSLPVFRGPEGSAAQMLALYRRLHGALARLELGVVRVELSGRGSWRVELDSGAALELGRGSEDEVMARSERFVRTYTQVAARWRRPLLHADLRHADGYAVRLQGVSTSPAAGNAARNN
ncbi:MAG: cell division protein FtsQ [Leptothrix sp. (in: Bacteria)]|nr:cell division protein FtsQ [Leptothrix sp. (in: b-proteobacteria)]